MNDACYCEISSGEPAEWYDTTYPVARKEHKCCECAEPIRKGEKYQKTVGKWEGEFETFVTCEHCSDLRAKLYAELRMDEPWAYGDLACMYATWLRADEHSSEAARGEGR